MFVAEQSNNGSSEAATQLAKFLLRTMEVKENGKVATMKLEGLEQHINVSRKAAVDVLRRLTKALKRVNLLEEEAQVLKMQT